MIKIEFCKNCNMLISKGSDLKYSHTLTGCRRCLGIGKYKFAKPMCTKEK